MRGHLHDVYPVHTAKICCRSAWLPAAVGGVGFSSGIWVGQGPEQSHLSLAGPDNVALTYSVF